MRTAFAKHRPWVTRFDIRGRSYGGSVSFEQDGRIAEFCSAFPDARTILELGSLEGGQTFEIARRLPHVRILGIEGRQGNVDRARLVQSLLGIDRVEFMRANIEALPFEHLGHFDAVLCSGLLYHLPRPWLLLDGLARLTGQMYLSTHFAADADVDADQDGVAGHWYQEHGQADPMSGLSPRSFWLPLRTITSRLENGGFEVTVTSLDEHHDNGPLLNLIARRTV